MKKLLAALFLSLPFLALAGNGDTIKVRSHDRVHMGWYGNYDQKAWFPTSGKNFHRVKMHYTLGCPDHGCSEWDYTAQVFLRKPTGKFDSTLQTAPNFRVNGNTRDSFFYSLDSTYTYFYNASLPGLDSTARLPVQLIFFNDAQNPTTATDTIEVWDALVYRPVYDMNGIQTDSTLVGNDVELYRNDHQWYNVFEVIQDYELGRLITPYAGDKTKTWSFTYTFDITEYQLLLKDSVTLRAHYSGYQDGFTVTLDFEFIEGEPALTCTDIIPLWNGGFPYSTNIENYLPERNVSITKKTNTFAKMRVIQTGHGFGGNENCAEFCEKDHYILVNGTSRFTTKVWRDQCGMNPIYPQTGTWIYDRANWCPGEAVAPYDYWIHDHLNDGANTVNLDLQPFTSSNGSASYIITGVLFIYEENTQAKADVALEEIIAPSSRNNHVRFNPTCGQPKVRVKNTSPETVNTIEFDYGVSGGTDYNWTWHGEIKPYETMEIDLAYFDWTGASSGKFHVSIAKVNYVADAESSNNSLESTFELTPQLEEVVQVWFKGNTRANESKLGIYSWDGTEIWTRSNYQNGVVTRDTIPLSNGCYFFRVEDAGKNGFKFWANNDGTGTLSLRNGNGTLLELIDGDFGTQYTYYFTVGHVVSVPVLPELELKMFPNPNTGMFQVRLEGESWEQSGLKVFNALGQEIPFEQVQLDQDNVRLDMQGAAPGVYFLKLIAKDGRQTSQRFVVH